MFPIRDTLRSKSFPLITGGFILLNTLVFLFELGRTDEQIQTFINHLGLVPASISPLHPWNSYRLITHLFIHGSWVHFIGNMWFLFVFGDNVEEGWLPAVFCVLPAGRYGRGFHGNMDDPNEQHSVHWGQRGYRGSIGRLSDLFPQSQNINPDSEFL